MEKMCNDSKWLFQFAVQFKSPPRLEVEDEEFKVIKMPSNAHNSCTEENAQHSLEMEEVGGGSVF